MKKDKTTEALRYARSILSSVGLSDWSVWSNNSYSTVGRTHFDRKRIVFSKRYIAIAAKEEFKRAVLHEAAHAIAGYEADHNEDFVEVCRKISPDQPYDAYCISPPIYRYNLICPVCGDTGETNKNTPLFCEVCPKEGRGVIEYRKINNDLEVTEWASTL